MLTVIHAMARLVRIVMALNVLASLAAGFGRRLSALDGYMRRGRTGLWDTGMTQVMLGSTFTIIGTMALIPAVLVILFAEATERRSATFYGAAGAGVALVWAGVLMLVPTLLDSGYSAVGPSSWRGPGVRWRDVDSRPARARGWSSVLAGRWKDGRGRAVIIRLASIIGGQLEAHRIRSAWTSIAECAAPAYATSGDLV